MWTIWLAAIAGAFAEFSCRDLLVGGKKFDLSDLGYTFQHSKVYDTPPTVTNRTVYMNPCGPVDARAGCPSDCMFCMVERVEVDGKTIVTKIVPYGSERANGTLALSSPYDGSRGVVYEFNGAHFGEVETFATISYACADSFSLRGNGGDVMSYFLEFDTPAACAVSDNPDKSPGKKPGNEEPKKGGWGLFTWLGFLVVLGLIVYAGLTAVANYRGNFGGARLDDWADLLRDTPYLLRDFIRKIVGLVGTRGGYSAI